MPTVRCRRTLGPPGRRRRGAWSSGKPPPHSQSRSPRGPGTRLLCPKQKTEEGITSCLGKEGGGGGGGAGGIRAISARSYIVTSLPKPNPAARASHPAYGGHPAGVLRAPPASRPRQPRFRPIKSGNETIHQLALTAGPRRPPSVRFTVTGE